MKTLTQSIATIALLGTLTLGSAMDIDAQLEAISTATDADRIELVNELKTELQSMTPEERQEVIAAVRAEIGVQDGTGDGEGEQIKTQLRQRSQSQNANGTQQMQAGEKAAQLRTGSKQGTKQGQGGGNGQGQGGGNGQGQGAGNY